MLNLSFDATDINNAKYLKRYKQRINFCSMASSKIVAFAHARKRKKNLESILIYEEYYKAKKLVRDGKNTFCVRQ